MIEKYLDRIKEATERTGVYAFRGQEDSSWPLHSSAARRLIMAGSSDPTAKGFSSEHVEYHKQLMDRSKILGFHLENDKEISALQLFAKLQHFGAATGLLDFSWNPLVALWFASCSPTSDGSPTPDGTIFAINTDDLVAMESFNTSSESITDLEEIFQRGNEAIPHLLFWEPTLRGTEMLRILRQRSVFIIGRPHIPTADVKIIIVDKDDKPLLLEQLETLDIDKRTLYPDLYGFCSRETFKSPLTAKFKPQDHLRQANEHYRAKAYQAAIASYNRCVDMVPDVSEVYFLRGNAKSQIGLYHEAIQDYALAIDRKDVPALGFDQEGLIVTEHWFLFSIYFNRGNSAFMLEDFETSVENFSQTIALSPEFAEAYYNRGNAYSELLLWDKAINDYDTAWQLVQHRRALFNKGNSLIRSRNIDKALSLFRQIQADGLNNVASQTNLAHLENISDLLANTSQMDVTMVELPNNPRVIELRSDGYKGQPLIFGFAGNIGNTGNMGGNKQAGGKGLPGRPAFSIRLQAQLDE